MTPYPEGLRYRALSPYLRQRFGKKVYKLPLDGGFTCPNRDGTVGTGGCLFCSEQGSGEFAEAGQSVGQQLARAKCRVSQKVPADAGYIPYFQSFTGTYAPTERLRRLFSEALAFPDMVGLSVATRPDCLAEDKLELLSELNEQKPVFTELGLQTANENTARYINRCYENGVFTKAVEGLRRRNIEVIVHIIIGLPGENERDLIQTVRFLNAHDIQGVKLQLLHVLSDSPLAKTDYTPLSVEKYFEWLALCLSELRDTTVIHRLTGDGDKKKLIAPLWSADKHRVRNGFERYLEENDIWQGKYFRE